MKNNISPVIVQFYSTLPSESIYIRKEVFVREQGFTREFDEKDENSSHVLVWMSGVAVATCRIVYGDVVTIGRIAVIKEYRKCGLGAQMINACLKKLKDDGVKIVVINAQERAVAFYEKCGFTLIGDESWEDGVKHVKMQTEL